MELHTHEGDHAHTHLHHLRLPRVAGAQADDDVRVIEEARYAAISQDQGHAKILELNALRSRAQAALTKAQSGGSPGAGGQVAKGQQSFAQAQWHHEMAGQQESGLIPFPQWSQHWNAACGGYQKAEDHYRSALTTKA